MSWAMHDKVEALGMLMKHLGLYTEHADHKETSKFVSDEVELARRIAFLLAKADKTAKLKS